jgi:hypothetical protein
LGENCILIRGRKEDKYPQDRSGKGEKLLMLEQEFFTTEVIFMSWNESS